RWASRATTRSAAADPRSPVAAGLQGGVQVVVVGAVTAVVDAGVENGEAADHDVVDVAGAVRVRSGPGRRRGVGQFGDGEVGQVGGHGVAGGVEVAEDDHRQAAVRAGEAGQAVELAAIASCAAEVRGHDEQFPGAHGEDAFARIVGKGLGCDHPAGLVQDQGQV